MSREPLGINAVPGHEALRPGRYQQLARLIQDEITFLGDDFHAEALYPGLMKSILDELVMYTERGFDAQEFIDKYLSRIVATMVVRERLFGVVNQRAVIHGAVNGYLHYIRNEKDNHPLPEPKKGSRPRLLSLFGLS